MNLLLRFLLFVPAIYLLLVVYVSPHCPDASSTLRLAARKSVKAVVWTAAIVLVMEAIALFFMP